MLGEFLTVMKSERPWGRFEQYTHNERCTVKIITVAPGGKLSRQYHTKRDELWIVLDPGARVELDEKVSRPEIGEKLSILRGTVHRLSAEGGGPVRILEVSFGDFDENDIVRLEDVYGRTGSAASREADAFADAAVGERSIMRPR